MVNDPTPPPPPDPGVDDPFTKWKQDYDHPDPSSSSSPSPTVSYKPVAVDSTALDRIGSRLLAAVSPRRHGIVIATPAAAVVNNGKPATTTWPPAAPAPAVTVIDGVKKKRGRPPRAAAAAAALAGYGGPTVAKRVKKEDEDVCFICFDGGSLVLCDRKDCPKAYHPACVKRDESFFKRRVRWNCGWHLCNICQKNAVFLCYTCPYSLCKACVKQADIYCVRGNKGFCKNCMTTVSLIENITEASKDMAHVDFDDIYSWEYLFKVYWVLLKQKESLTLDEIRQAGNPWKVQQVPDQKNAYPSVGCHHVDVNIPPVDVTVNRTVDVVSVNRTVDVDVNRTVEVDVNRTVEVDVNRTADEAVNRTSESAEVSVNRTAEAAVNRTPDANVSRTAEANVSRTSEANVSRTPDATANRTPDATANRTPDATANRSPGATANRSPGATVNRSPDATVNRSPDATVNRSPDATVNRSPDATVNRSPDATVNRSSDATVNRSPDATVNRSPDATVNRTLDAAVNRNSDSSCSTIHPALNEGHVELNGSKRRKTRKQSSVQIKSQEKIVHNQHYDIADWASKELLEFVAHMKNGDTSQLSQYDVQALLLEYIKKHNLRDPQRKSHIICDKRLEGLFGKVRVGHFEMLGLLERHFKEDSHPNGVVLGASVEASCSYLDSEWQSNETPTTSNRPRKRLGRKRGDGRVKQQINLNLDSYAAIDMHNMNLIYLKRSLMENLVDVVDKFHDNVVGSVVRIRIHGNDHKQQDMYRLVRVVGTSKAAEPYKIGEKSTRLMLKILNLDKIEDVAIDLISNQDFSEDECRRLRQSIKCGLMGRMTVGEVQEKATALEAFRLRDILEAEILKLNHLRDRASEMGHRKELRECFEKLEVLKSPEERQRRLQKIPEVHADPRMDPSCHSDEDSELLDTNKGSCTAPKYVNSNSKPMELITSQNGDTPHSARAKMLRSSSSSQKKSMIMKSQRSKEDTPSKSCESTPSSLELETHAARILEELSKQVDPSRLSKQEPETSANNPSPQIASSDASVTSSSTGTVLSCEYSELEKLWHYQDPTGKIQGPFCMLQLRKWNSSGYFPADLRVWKINESQHSSVFLTDAMSVHCHNTDYHFQCGHICLGAQDTKVTSDGRKPEHDGQMSSTVNSDLKGHEQNEGSDSGMTEEAACSGDKNQPETEGNNRKDGDVQCSQISSEENQKSPSGERSLSKVEEVGDPSLVSCTAEPHTKVDPSGEHEVSDATVSPSYQDLQSSRMETEKDSASITPVKNSTSSSWSVSYPQPQLEEEDPKEGEAENKDDNRDLTHKATRDKEQLVTSAIVGQALTSSHNLPNQTELDENSQPKAELTMGTNLLEQEDSGTTSCDGPPDQSRSELSCLPLQKQEQGNKDQNLQTAGQATVDLNVPGKDTGMASWDSPLIQSRSEFSDRPNQTQQLDDKDKNSQTVVRASMANNSPGPVPASPAGQSLSEFSNLPKQAQVLDDKFKDSHTEAKTTTALNLSGWDSGIASSDGSAIQSKTEFPNPPILTKQVEDKDKFSHSEARATMVVNLPGQDSSTSSWDDPAVQNRGEFLKLTNQSQQLDEKNQYPLIGPNATESNQTQQLEDKDKVSHCQAGVSAALNLPGQNSSTSSWVGPAVQNRSEFPKLRNQPQQLVAKDQCSLMEANATVALNLPTQDSGTCSGDGPAIRSISELSNWPNQTQGLNDNNKNPQTEAKAIVSLNIPQVEDSGPTSWNALSGEMNFSAPVGSTHPENEGNEVDMSMGHRITPALPCEAIGVSWSTASSLVLDEPINVSSDWGGYSHMHKPGEELGNGLSSIPSIFAELFDGPIEFDTLGDQSVSDLLSEVEAMEMNGGIMPSPNNDCFSPLAGLSPPPEGGKSDSWSSTCDMQFHSEPSPMGDTQHHYTVFGLDLNDCSTNPSNPYSSSPPVAVGGEIKLGLGSSQPSQSFLSAHHATSPPLPNLNLVSSSGGFGFEDVKPSYVHLNLQGLGSHGFSTASLSTGMGATINSVGEMQPGNMSRSRDFVPQGQNLSVSAGSVDFSSRSRPVKIEVNEACMSRQKVTAPVDLPCPKELPQSRSPSIVLKPSTSSPIQGGEVNHRAISQAALLRSLSPPSQPPLLAPSPPSSSEMTPSRLPSPAQPSSYLPPSQPAPAPLSILKMTPSRLPSPPLPSQNPTPHLLSPPPTQMKDTSSSPVEEGEVEEPVTDHLGTNPSSHPSPQTSSPIEEGEVKPSSPILSNTRKEEHPTAQSNPLPSSTRVPYLKPPALDVSMSGATGRVSSRERSSFSPPGSSPRNNASSFSPHASSSPRNAKGSFTTGNPRESGPTHHIVSPNHQGVIRTSNQTRYQGVLGRPSSSVLKDRSHHPHPYQHPIIVSPGFVKPSRQSWNRQPSFGSSGGGIGGSPRQQSSGLGGRGPRICKFYERGCCRKGASCNYLHPS